MGLGCAEAHVIFVVILGITNQKVIGSTSGQRNDIETFAHSENSEEISSRELLHGWPWGPIGVNLSAIRDTGYKTVVNSYGKSFV